MKIKGYTQNQVDCHIDTAVFDEAVNITLGCDPAHEKLPQDKEETKQGIDNSKGNNITKDSDTQLSIQDQDDKHCEHLGDAATWRNPTLELKAMQVNRSQDTRKRPASQQAENDTKRLTYRGIS